MNMPFCKCVKDGCWAPYKKASLDDSLAQQTPTFPVWWHSIRGHVSDRHRCPYTAPFVWVVHTRTFHSCEWELHVWVEGAWAKATCAHMWSPTCMSASTSAHESGASCTSARALCLHKWNFTCTCVLAHCSNKWSFMHSCLPIFPTIQFWTGHGPVVGHNPGFGDPCSSGSQFWGKETLTV